MSCRFSQNQSPIPFNWRKIGAEGTKMASGWPSTAAAHMLASICWWAVTLRTAFFFSLGAPLWVGQVPKGPKTRKWQLTKAIFVNGLECTNTELMDLEGVGQNIHFSLASRTCMTFKSWHESGLVVNICFVANCMCLSFPLNIWHLSLIQTTNSQHTLIPP